MRYFQLFHVYCAGVQSCLVCMDIIEHKPTATLICFAFLLFAVFNVWRLEGVVNEQTSND